jgi:hypothetical protein
MRKRKQKNFLRNSKMAFIFFYFFFTILSSQPVLAEPFESVEKDFLWTSSNLTPIQSIHLTQDSKRLKSKKTQPIKALSYKNYLDQKGSHPPYPFLSPLKETGHSIAEIKNGRLHLRKAGRSISLDTPSFPQGASPVPPYLLSTPDGKWILVVYPYYLHQDKENWYLTEVYTEQGIRVAAYDSLPTHVSASKPDLFVSPERTGCCESLKWSIRFYRPSQRWGSEYSCPEGFCGDILFTKLGDHGPFMIVQEIVGKVGEIGASMQTNFYIVENDGNLSASGKTLYALRESHLDQKRIESLSPYAISNLISIEPLSEKGSWLLLFESADQMKGLKLTSNHIDPAPSPVFLLPKDPLTASKKEIKLGNRHFGKLPLLGITHSGQMNFTLFSEGDREEKFYKEIRSDFINILVF